MRNWQFWVLTSGLAMACMGEVEDSGIIYPNPKANFKLGTSDSDESYVNSAVLRQLDSITLTNCAGQEEVLSFSAELRSDDDSFVSMESDNLTCISKMEIAASDVGGLAALSVGIESNGQNIQLQCPAAQCFPMVFEGTLELSAPDEDDAGGLVHELRMNILRTIVLPNDAPMDQNFIAGECEGEANCISLEKEVTENGAIEQLEANAGEDVWTEVLSAAP